MYVSQLTLNICTKIRQMYCHLFLTQAVWKLRGKFKVVSTKIIVRVPVVKQDKFEHILLVTNNILRKSINILMNVFYRCLLIRKFIITCDFSKI